MSRASGALSLDGPEQTRRLGELLAARLRGGDVVVLDGPLGAGKTTFVQGLAAGLGVTGPVTSPTFVLARVQPSSRAGGPDLVHVDAYRLGSVWELDDLDLDSDLDRAVVAVEWGGGLAERLSPDRVEVRLARPGAEARRAELRGVGERWQGVDLASDLASELAAEPASEPTAEPASEPAAEPMARPATAPARGAPC